MKENNSRNKLGFLVLILFVSYSLFGQDQIRIANFDTTGIPKAMKFEGHIKNAVRWDDRLGDNIVITTETGIFQSGIIKHENDGSDAELFAYHFIIKSDSILTLWRVYDYIYDCPVDMEALFIKGTFQVTDLNNDGIAEIWLMYKTVCHGDVSPSDMKIIMYQGQQKYAMRGQNRVKISEKEYYGGEYKFDSAFKNGPVIFRKFAENLWNKNLM